MLDEQERRLGEQERVLADQQRQIAEQRALIDRQRAELAALTGVSDADLSEMRAAGAPGQAPQIVSVDPDMPIMLNRRPPLRRYQDSSAPSGGPVAPADGAPDGPVGEAPPDQPLRRIESVPEEASVLTQQGHFTLDAGVEYTHVSSNRLVFRGVEIVTGIQIGLIEASEASRDTFGASLSARYGLTRRLELELRAPYLVRSDRVKTLAQRDETVSRTLDLDGADIGDVEFGVRYQINGGRNGGPIYVAGLRLKSDTGRGPFDIPRDEFGVATELATGSGFWGVQASVSAMVPSDPVVLYASAAYTYSIAKDIDQEIAGVMVGRVDPGDSISVGGGFGFSLNPRFSYSMGYSHTYVMETESEIGDTLQRSTSIQAGSLQLGVSYRFNEERSLNIGFDFGVTEEAPDVRISFRTPFRF